jgi:hypothetical protein
MSLTRLSPTMSIGPSNKGWTRDLAHLIAVEFGNRRNAVDVADQVGFRTQKSLESNIAFDTGQEATIGRNPQFFDLRRSPILAQQRKEEMRQALTEHLTSKLRHLDRVSVQLNTLDDPARGEDGMYLTVLGTSAEGGDGGQVGRGNRVNGVIPLNRPISNEAAAGKNPVSHVGKIYSLLTHHIANAVVQQVEGVAEVYVWLCSQIGQPINQPLIAASRVILQEGVRLPDVQPSVEAIIEQELAGIHEFSKRLVRGELPVW